MTNIGRALGAFIVILLWGSTALAALYEVGPGKTYNRIIDCPTHNLQPGDTIKVYYRAEPYREKFLLNGTGTAENPITLIGVPDEDGNKPIIDGQDAVSNTGFSYWNEDRQIILVGQYTPYLADYIIVDGFVLRNANRHHTYTDDSANVTSYASNACGLRTEYANHVVVRNCEIYNNENGIQSGTGNSQELTVEYCHIHDNGAGSSTSSQEHNLYMTQGSDGDRVIVQFCRFGELLNDGQQCKFRTATVVFRYNWVHGGRNSMLDLVEDPNRTIPANAYVYGNVIIKPAVTNNGRIIHFGGDQSGSVRAGTLYFFNNTCIINNESRASTIFSISRPDADVVADNNIFYKNTSQDVNVWSGFENITGSDNWISVEIGLTSVFQQTISGSDPGFVDTAEEIFGLQKNSPCLNRVADYDFPAGYNLDYQYVKHLRGKKRLAGGSLDLGAFELAPNDVPARLILLLSNAN